VPASVFADARTRFFAAYTLATYEPGGPVPTQAVLDTLALVAVGDAQAAPHVRFLIEQLLDHVDSGACTVTPAQFDRLSPYLTLVDRTHTLRTLNNFAALDARWELVRALLHRVVAGGRAAVATDALRALVFAARADQLVLGTRGDDELRTVTLLIEAGGDIHLGDDAFLRLLLPGTSALLTTVVLPNYEPDYFTHGTGAAILAALPADAPAHAVLASHGRRVRARARNRLVP